MKRTKRLMIGVLIVAASLRLFRLDARSLWFDEALSVLIGRLTLAQVLTGAAGSHHPPFYYLLLHVWQAIGLGTNDWLLRFPSGCVSLVAVALTYRVGRDLFDRWVGLVAALGMALSPFQVYYAQEARMYALATALVLGATWCLFYAIRRPSRSRLWIGYTLLSALGLYTHYFVAWVILALHVWLVVSWRRDRDVCRPLLTADVGVGLAFLPQGFQFLTQAGDYLVGGMAWQARPHALAPLTTLEYLLFGHLTQSVYWWWGLRVAVVTCVLAFALLEWTRRSDRRWRRRSGALLSVLFIPLVLVVVISWLVEPIYLERSFAALSPFLLMFLAQGVVAVPVRFSPTRWVGLALGVLLVTGTAAHYVLPDVAKPPVREAMAVVADDFRMDDLCLHVDETYFSALVYEPALSQALWHIDVWSMHPSTYRVLGGRLVVLQEALSVEGRLWLVVTDRSRQPWEQVLVRVEEERHLRRVWNWPYLSLYLYE